MGSIRSNYHTHSRYDDGKGELSEYLASARDRGFSYLGFSGHAPANVPSTWHMSGPGADRYREDVLRLREGDTGGVVLLLGLEVDYLPGYVTPSRSVAPGLDYVIGAVHYVLSPPEGQPGWTVDGPPEELDRGLERDFGGDIRGLVAAYYRRIAEMVRTSPPDIVAHFDLIKKNNTRGERFSEDALWYRTCALDALDAVAASGCVMEVNTGGLNRGTVDAAYPSAWLLSECRRRGIRMVVGSDAHRPEHLDGHFEHARAELLRAGYARRVELTPVGWIEREL